MSTVLIVEDSLLSRSFINLALGDRPEIKVLEAGDGAEALHVLEVEQVDLILSDLNMPKLDGLELARRVRASGPPLCDVPVILITTESEADQLEAARDAGADAYLRKPVQSQDLNPLLDRFLGSGSYRSGPAPLDDPTEILLLMADSPARGALIHELSGALNIELHPATSCMEAIGQLFLNDIQLALVDMNVGNREAPAFLQQLRGNTTYSSLPTILLADEQARTDLAEFDNFGAVQVLDRQARAGDVSEAVGEHLASASR